MASTSDSEPGLARNVRGLKPGSMKRDKKVSRVFTRNQQWLQKRHQKQQRQRQQRQQTSAQECTFRPKINARWTRPAGAPGPRRAVLSEEIPGHGEQRMSIAER